jgi:cyanate lyase
MKRNIPIEESDDHEGACYDPTLARMEGLYEEMQVFFMGHEIPINEGFLDAVLHATDLAVNVGPDDEQEIELVVRYAYHYGRPEVEVKGG